MGRAFVSNFASRHKAENYTSFAVKSTYPIGLEFKGLKLLQASVRASLFTENYER
jgi:hypothetical protein